MRTMISCLGLQLILCIASITALPPLNRPAPTPSDHPKVSASYAENTNSTRLSFLTKDLTSFPPGVPSNPFDYIIPDTDLAIHFVPLGLIPNRNETLVNNLLREALYATFDYRIIAKIPARGIQLQKQDSQGRDFIFGVSHSVGVHELTWGMWTIVLTGMAGYVQAYPGYDFMFEIEKFRDDALEGYNIGAGFAMTRASGG